MLNLLFYSQKLLPQPFIIFFTQLHLNIFGDYHYLELLR